MWETNWDVNVLHGCEFRFCGNVLTKKFLKPTTLTQQYWQFCGLYHSIFLVSYRKNELKTFISSSLFSSKIKLFQIFINYRKKINISWKKISKQSDTIIKTFFFKKNSDFNTLICKSWNTMAHKLLSFYIQDLPENGQHHEYLNAASFRYLKDKINKALLDDLKHDFQYKIIKKQSLLHLTTYNVVSVKGNRNKF